MKKLKNLLRLLLAAVVLVGMFAACEGPEGPAGPKGDQGDPGDPGDNVVNWEGFKEGIKCADCHNPDIDTLYYVWGIRTQWALSKHANGGAYFENSSTCAPCHTTEGFVEVALGRTPTAHTNFFTHWLLCLSFTAFTCRLLTQNHRSCNNVSWC